MELQVIFVFSAQIWNKPNVYRLDSLDSDLPRVAVERRHKHQMIAYVSVRREQILYRYAIKREIASPYVQY